LTERRRFAAADTNTCPSHESGDNVTTAPKSPFPHVLKVHAKE
jgi:hypothetical protein